MADPLSVISGIVGIAATGVKVSLSLYQFAEEVGSAAKDAKYIGSEISNFCFILRVLGTTLQEVDSGSVLRCNEVAEEMTARCLAMFIEILELVQELQKYIGAPGENNIKWKAKIRLALQKPRITYLRASLDSYKTTLNLLLETLNLADKVAKRKSLPPAAVDQENDTQQQSLIQSLEHAHCASIAELQELEQDLYIEAAGKLASASEGQTSDDEPSRDSHISTTSAERSTVIQTLREDLESLRASRASISALRLSDSTSRPRCSIPAARNSDWLLQEQASLKRWSSSLVSSDEPPNKNHSRRSMDLRRSRRATQIIPGGLSLYSSLLSGDTIATRTPITSTTILNDFKDWLATLSSDDRYQVWSIIVPVLLRSSDDDLKRNPGESRFQPRTTDMASKFLPGFVPANYSPTRQVFQAPHPESSLAAPLALESGQSSSQSPVQIFRSFRTWPDDTTYDLLPSALHAYNITKDWWQYSLYITSGEEERCLGLNEKPLRLFLEFEREGRSPTFMLRKHESPVVEHPRHSKLVKWPTFSKILTSAGR